MRKLRISTNFYARKLGKITVFFEVFSANLSRVRNMSSIVNDGIGGVLYLLRKDPTSTKSTKCT